MTESTVELSTKFHKALNPGEAPNAAFMDFVVSVGLPALLGLIGGGIVDWVTQILQNGQQNNEKLRCGKFFLAQLGINILILFFANRLIPTFVPWIQMTLAGFLFNVLFFTSQETLQTNCSCLF